MHPIPKHLLERFAEHFAYQRSGFKLNDITPHFSTYQAGLPASTFDGVSRKKGDHFVHVVGLMQPRQQRYALSDLCNAPPPIQNCPCDNVRLTLLNKLFASDGITPISTQLSQVTLCGVREGWWTATSRLSTSPAAAVTAARTLLESTFQTIVTESGSQPDGSGDLLRLFKQTRELLGLQTGQNFPRELNELCSGMTSVVNALAAISNRAGDRHGSQAGLRLEDGTVAALMVHSAGVLSYSLTQLYLDSRFSSAAQGGRQQSIES